MLSINSHSPSLIVPTTDGESFNLSKSKSSKFSLVTFYRGLHCPVCKDYLEKLDSLLPRLKEIGVDDVVAISADSKTRAEKAKTEWDISNLKVGYDLKHASMREWGLYISSAIKDQEPHTFNEPGLFLITPEKKVFYAAVNSMPFGRPELESFVKSIDFILKEEYPARGTFNFEGLHESLEDSDFRENRHNVEDFIIKRWSPRAFDKTQSIPQSHMDKIFAAAKWAPSAFNEQPWSFRVANHGSDSFSKFLNLLESFNQEWAQNASSIVFVVGQKTFEKNGEENTTYQFDCGASWMALSYQAFLLGYNTHAMSGIKKQESSQFFDLNEDKHEVICAFAIGKNVTEAVLSDDMKEKEELSDRKSLNEITNYY